MTYEEYLNAIEVLKTTNSNELKDKLLEQPLNDNIKHLLTPKIKELIEYKLKKSVNKIIRNLTEIFNDVNILDYYLLNLKKEITFIYDLTKLKCFTKEEQQELQQNLQEDVEEIYNILEKEASYIDSIGILSQIIKNNRIKWK